jgi:hypothetical protein
MAFPHTPKRERRWRPALFEPLRNQVVRLTKVDVIYDEYKTVNTKVPNAKVYPREILQAFKELEAIQPPPGFAEYQQRVKRADKKFEAACKRHGLDSLRVIMDFRLS